MCLYLNGLENEALTIKVTKVLCILANNWNTSLCSEFSASRIYFKFYHQKSMFLNGSLWT
jgi:hypothetical protein